MPDTPHIVFLTGAPQADDLDWHIPSLVAAFDSPIRRFLAEEGVPCKSTAGATTQQSPSLPKWRALSLPAPGNAAQHRAMRDRANANLVAFQDATENAKTRDDLEHLTFLEHSLAVLQSLDSSQIALPDGNDTTAFTTGSFNATFNTDASIINSVEPLVTHSSDRLEQRVVSFNGPFTDLKHIPTARHLLSLHPQTMTVNCLASVISVQPARTVRFRKRAGEMDVIEVLLGDETRAGFNVVFWVPPAETRRTTRSAGKDGLRETLNSLRAGDIVLLTHIALQAYQNTVSGQSLSRRITRNNTTLTVISDNVTGLSAPVAAKLQRVQKWSRDFIGLARGRASAVSDPARSNSRTSLDLPPETQTYLSGL